jgi:4-amino-4-deoxy-L-arabinose transferase-like glycosyltransferase
MIKKYLFNRTELILLILIIVLYFVLRLPNLTLQPVFADEAIYVRWAQVMKAEATLRYLPLSDGKTPLYMWMLMPIFKIVADPLLAGRLLSVFAGFFTVLGVYFLSSLIFNRRAGLFSAFLIAVTPYILFLDRLALVDSMLSAITIWTIYLAILTAKYLRIDLAMVTGYLLGAGIITKTPGMFSMIMLPSTFISFMTVHSYKKKTWQLIGLWAISLVIGLVIYNSLRLGPGFNNLNSRNGDYIFSPTRLLETPFNPFIPHVLDLADWSLRLIGIPAVLALFAGIYVIIKKKNKYGLNLLVWSIFPMLGLMALLQTFTTRYLLFLIPPLVCVMGYGIDAVVSTLKQNKKLFLGVVLVILSSWPLYFNFLLLTNPEKAPLPVSERTGFFEDWTSGYGLYEIAQMVNEESKTGPVVIGTQGTFGTLPDGIQIYFDKNPNVVVIGTNGDLTEQLVTTAVNTKTYFIADKSRFHDDQNPQLKLIREYPKAIKVDGSRNATLLFQVIGKSK